MAGLILVAGFALMPGNLTSHTVLVAADFTAEDGHVFTSYVDLARLTLRRHLWTGSVSSVLPKIRNPKLLRGQSGRARGTYAVVEVFIVFDECLEQVFVILQECGLRDDGFDISIS